jgi:microcystin-dependent protein
LNGYLRCDGSSYAQNSAQYNALFSVIGNTFNTSNTPVNYFSVPDLNNRVIVGFGNTDSNIDISGGIAIYQGSNAITIPANALPKHSHAYTNRVTATINSTTPTTAVEGPVATQIPGVVSIRDANGFTMGPQTSLDARNPYVSHYYLIKT